MERGKETYVLSSREELLVTVLGDPLEVDQETKSARDDQLETETQD